jgi:transcriptional regulator with XRE-family HTH domain
VQKYEEGTDRITAGALYQLAIKLEVLVQYFFRRVERAAREALIALDDRVSAACRCWKLLKRAPYLA